MISRVKSRRRFFSAISGSVVALAGGGAGMADGRIGAEETRMASAAKIGRMNLSFRPYELKLCHAFGLAKNVRTTTQGVQVEIELDGVVGRGEASMPPYLGESAASVLEFLGRVDLSPFKNPFEMEEILAYIDGITENNTAAKASVDIALHDLVGKLIGQPWWKIWGLSREKAPVTLFTIGIDSPDVVRRKTEEAASFPFLKVKIGRDPKSDREMIETIRSVTDKPLAVDANQGWDDKIYALEMVQWLQEKGVVFVEQPMSKKRPEANAWVTERSPIPIIGDESFQRLSDVRRLAGVFSGVNIKLMKCSGMREAWKILQLARAFDMKVMVGCMTETSCAISAAAQLSPAVDWADLDGNLLIANDPFEGVKAENGRLILSDRPGIGIEPKQAANEK